MGVFVLAAQAWIDAPDAYCRRDRLSNHGGHIAADF